MHRLCSLLGMPQNRFTSIHVVGTNGKTSVARMTMALLEANRVSAGAYVSPHIVTWRERILIHGEPISEEAFTAALERTEESAQVADRAAGDEGPVTQFELVTAAAFVALAEARVEVGVIEAGLGGRLDATNVIPSKVTVLTPVGLDHTEWLGETVEEIAAEKTAVLRDHTTLVTGFQSPDVDRVVERELVRKHAKRAQQRHAIAFGAPGPSPLPGYQQQNMALAALAAREVLGISALDVSEFVVATENPIPGRAQLVEGDPPLIFDAAHNPDGAAALAEVLPSLVPTRKVRRGLRTRSEPRDVICCLAILAEKDAKAMVEALAKVCSVFICTQIAEETIRGSGRPVGTSYAAEDLAELCRAAGADAEAVPEPLDAWRRAREIALERNGAALAAGSHYLLSSIWTERPDPNS